MSAGSAIPVAVISAVGSDAANGTSKAGKMRFAPYVAVASRWSVAGMDIADRFCNL